MSSQWIFGGSSYMCGSIGKRESLQSNRSDIICRQNMARRNSTPEIKLCCWFEGFISLKRDNGRSLKSQFQRDFVFKSSKQGSSYPNCKVLNPVQSLICQCPSDSSLNTVPNFYCSIWNYDKLSGLKPHKSIIHSFLEWRAWAPVSCVFCSEFH